jgi:Protein of unknown function (DUF3182)
MAAGSVFIYRSSAMPPWSTEVYALIDAVARQIADLKGYKFRGTYANSSNFSGPSFFVPDDTLLSHEALSIGIRSNDDFFGGVVPYPFVKTKAITHRLVSNTASSPPGWSAAFSDRVRGAVLPGYTVFSAGDARFAAKRLLRFGSVRLKDPRGAGGRLQTVIANIPDLDIFLKSQLADGLRDYGLVLEVNLQEARTFNIGQIEVNGQVASYVGTQRLTTDNEGRKVIGGSDILCVRGSWNALDSVPMPIDMRVGLHQAKEYDQALHGYRGFIASRRNYDVGIGLDDKGTARSGVFESSLRFGGASTAELAAVAHFGRDPTLRIVEASVVKVFGRNVETPKNALVHFRGDDSQLGPMARYTIVTRVER